MKYLDFASRAVKQDVRNVFSPSSVVPDVVPLSLRSFYNEYNPVDVEVNTEKYGVIHFYGVDHLAELQEEYFFYPREIFIFATCNGDPFFVGNDGKVYTSLESSYCPEEVADNFEDFLTSCFL